MKKVANSIYVVGLIIIFISHAQGNRGYSYAGKC